MHSGGSSSLGWLGWHAGHTGSAGLAGHATWSQATLSSCTWQRSSSTERQTLVHQGLSRLCLCPAHWCLNNQTRHKVKPRFKSREMNSASWREKWQMGGHTRGRDVGVIFEVNQGITFPMPQKPLTICVSRWMLHIYLCILRISMHTFLWGLRRHKRTQGRYF